MEVKKWMDVVAFLAVLQSLTCRKEQNAIVSSIRELFPGQQQARLQIRQKMSAGIGDSDMKVSESILQRFDGYLPDEAAWLVGRHESRIRKAYSDRTLQDVLQYQYFAALCKSKGLDPSEMTGTASPELAATAGLCRAIHGLKRRWFPDRTFPAVKNGILPIQTGLLLNELLVWPQLSKLNEYGWSAKRMIRDVPALGSTWAGLIDRVNQPIADSNLVGFLTQVDLDNVDDLLANAREYAWPYFLVTELDCSQDHFEHDLPFPIVGIWDEFRDGGSGRGYSSVPA